MKKQFKPILYLGAGLILIAFTIFALLNYQTNPTAEVTSELVTITDARANSYQPILGGLEVKENDLVIGSEKAPLKIFVYEDYSSPLSATLADTLNKLSKENNGRLAIVVRPFVLNGNSISLDAALAYTCALEAGKGEEMRAKLFALAKEDNFNTPAVTEEAKNLKINEAEFQDCLTNQEKSLKLEEGMNEAKANLVLGAPTMFVGDEMILGARPYSDFVDSNGDAIEGLKTVVDRKLNGI